MENEFFSTGGSSSGMGSNQLIKYIAIGLVAAAIAYAVYYFFFRKDARPKHPHHQKQGGGGGVQTAPGGSKTPQVALYHMAGCSWCTKFRPIWEAAKQKYAQTIDFIEHQYPEAKEAIQAAGVNAFPTVHAYSDGSQRPGGVFQLQGDDYALSFDQFLQQQLGL